MIWCYWYMGHTHTYTYVRLHMYTLIWASVSRILSCTSTGLSTCIALVYVCVQVPLRLSDVQKFLKQLNEKAARLVKLLTVRGWVVFLNRCFHREASFENLFADLSQFPALAKGKRVSKQNRKKFSPVWCTCMPNHSPCLWLALCHGSRPLLTLKSSCKSTRRWLERNCPLLRIMSLSLEYR